MVSVSVRYLFYQPMDKKIKTWPLRFLAKENPNMEKVLFDRPIMLQYDVTAKYQLISRKFSGVTFVQPREFACSRVFISRSYENRSIFVNRSSSNTDSLGRQTNS